MTPRLFECMRVSARARRNVEAAELELGAARTQLREANEEIARADGADQGVARRFVRARCRLNEARLAYATATDLLNDRNDELALALFEECGLSPACEDLPAERRSQLALLVGGLP